MRHAVNACDRGQDQRQAQRQLQAANKGMLHLTRLYHTSARGTTAARRPLFAAWPRTVFMVVAIMCDFSELRVQPEVKIEWCEGVRRLQYTSLWHWLPGAPCAQPAVRNSVRDTRSDLHETQILFLNGFVAPENIAFTGFELGCMGRIWRAHLPFPRLYYIGDESKRTTILVVHPRKLEKPHTA